MKSKENKIKQKHKIQAGWILKTNKKNAIEQNKTTCLGINHCRNPKKQR